MAALAPPWPAIAAATGAATGKRFAIQAVTAACGGCINSAWRIDGDGARYFVKLNSERHRTMFEAEAEGLAEIAAAGALRAPRPVCHGAAQGWAWLVLEHIDLSGGAPCSRRLGRELAAMHRHTASRFGWRRDNTIGSTPQPNTPCDDWIRFWRERRLGFQLDLARRNGYGGELQRLGKRLLARLEGFFPGYAPQASLLHGDLWGGNYGCDASGAPVIFDPAVYYGDREADLAMTELFGGFGGRFHAAYREAWPLDPGYAARKDLYNLYHVLNHLNLFGGGYRSQAQGMMRKLSAHLG